MERNSPHIKSASERQGSDKYPGIDTYDCTTLRKNTKICALVAYYENGRMKPCEFYFPQKVLQQVNNNPIKLSQGLQISPWKNPKTGEYSYRTRVATFIVAEDFETEYSAKVSENPSYGTGGMIQYHIPKESAEKYLIKEPDDIFLSDGQISEDEYEEIMEKHQQMLIKRNLFSYLKAKADTLDILQNTSDEEEKKRTEKNLRTLDRHIEDLTIDLACSQEKIGDIHSEKYDRLINQLVVEIESREEDNVLLVSNVKVLKEIEEVSQRLNQSVDFILAPCDSQNDAGQLAENIANKIDSYEKELSSGGKPSIDVPKQNLSDFLTIHQINKQRCEVMENLQPQTRNYQPINTIVIQSQNGQHQRIPIETFFTSESIASIREARNGSLTPTLHFKGNDLTAKLFMRGNKTQLYLAQTKEQLAQTLDRIQLSSSQREKLQQGGSVRLRQGHYHLDPELNCLVPCTNPSDEAQQNNTNTQINSLRKRGPTIL